MPLSRLVLCHCPLMGPGHTQSGAVRVPCGAGAMSQGARAARGRGLRGGAGAAAGARAPQIWGGGWGVESQMAGPALTLGFSSHLVTLRQSQGQKSHTKDGGAERSLRHQWQWKCHTGPVSTEILKCERKSITILFNKTKQNKT